MGTTLVISIPMIFALNIGALLGFFITKIISYFLSKDSLWFSTFFKISLYINFLWLIYWVLLSILSARQDPLYEKIKDTASISETKILPIILFLFFLANTIYMLRNILNETYVNKLEKFFLYSISVIFIFLYWFIFSNAVGIIWKL